MSDLLNGWDSDGEPEMTTICKDCGVRGKGVHHCEAAEPMSDLMERGRALAGPRAPGIESLVGELVDAIEQLAELAAAKQLLVTAVKQENKTLQAKVDELTAALEPFTHPDLRLRLGGNSTIEGDSAIVFQRNSAKLRLRDFDKAAQALAEVDDE